MTTSEITLIPPLSVELAAPPAALPEVITNAGAAASFAWEEFFTAGIPNMYTRVTYKLAVDKFLKWLEPQRVPLMKITPGMVGRYFDEHPGSIPTKKVHLSAIRGLFDKMVTRHVMMLNPAASVRLARHAVTEGKTPEISADHARALLASIRTRKDDPETAAAEPLPVGLRDAAVIATLIYTAARAGAVARLRMRDLIHDGTQYLFRFQEKGGKQRQIPIRHDLQGYLLNYIDGAGLGDADRNTPLFRSANRRTGKLTATSITGQDICRIIKRRLEDAGLPNQYSPHSIRVATITNLLLRGVPLEQVQFLAGHSDPRVTRLYDRRHKQVTRRIVDMISI